ncbi:hypothetical protein [Haloactinopolyspora alba]|uniref:hypothetical protein n=1 Tax=Haloactinopolyspora alba TaxID=648780 RepID=UPI00101C83DF|nr:hypothetical protein [Haloactinopolyspora alba]
MDSPDPERRKKATTPWKRPNRWNLLSADVSDWEHRSSITKIEVSFRGLGSSDDWGGRFQIDKMGWL